MITRIPQSVHSSLVILLLASVLSCKKDSNAGLEITVLSPDNLPLSGVMLNVIEESGSSMSAIKQLSTSSNGSARSLISAGVNYAVYLVPGVTTAPEMYINNSEATYLARGTFESQQEINSSATQAPQARIGDLRYTDFNADGVINELDLVLPVGSVSKAGFISVTLSLEHR